MGYKRLSEKVDDLQGDTGLFTPVIEFRSIAVTKWDCIGRLRNAPVEDARLARMLSLTWSDCENADIDFMQSYAVED